VFSLTQVAISTVVGAVLAYVVVVVYARWIRITVSSGDTLLLAVTVGVSILLWREEVTRRR
jgi:carbon starvation protein CstA